MELDVAILWQLRGLRGNEGMYIYVAVTGIRGNFPLNVIADV